MSDFQDLFSGAKSGKTAAGEVEDYEGQDFTADVSPGGPPPDPAQSFDELRAGRKTISQILAETPSLDSLFQPFAYDAPDADFNKFQEEFTIPPARDYVFEDLDTRNPEVIRTLDQAEEEKARILKEAEAKLSEAEKQALLALESLTAQAEGQAGDIVDEARRQAALLLEEAAEARRLAEEAQKAAEELRAEAEEAKAETQRLYQEAEQKIQSCEEEKNQKLAELEAFKEENRLSAEKALLEARTQGHGEGLAQGLAEGRAKGEAEAKSQFQNKTAGLVTALEKVSDLYEDLWRANEPMMIKLAIEAAGQIVNKELSSSSSDLAKRAFSACVDYLSQAHKVVFHARPADLAQLEEARLEERERLGGLVKISFLPDPALGPGDLIMESDVGRLDATIKNRSDKVLSVLRRAFEENYLHSQVDFFNDGKREEAAAPPTEEASAPSENETATPLDEEAPEAAASEKTVL